MSDRMSITRADLDTIFGRLTRVATSLGLDTSNWRIGQLSGMSYRIAEHEPATGGLSHIFGDGYLGTTKREAWETMHAYCVALDMVDRAPKR